MLPNLKDLPINETFGGVLHTSNQAVSGSDFKQIYDGFGNPTPLSVSKNAVKIGGVTYDTKAPENETGASLVYNNGSVTFKNILDTIYPIGSIYLSINPSNPTSLFGGSWEAVAQGRFLVGVGTSSTQVAGFPAINFKAGIDPEDQGVYEHTLVKKEVPVPTYYQFRDCENKVVGSYMDSLVAQTNIGLYGVAQQEPPGSPPKTPQQRIKEAKLREEQSILEAKNDGAIFATYVTDVNSPNYPPYFGAYIWKRIS